MKALMAVLKSKVSDILNRIDPATDDYNQIKTLLEKILSLFQVVWRRQIEYEAFIDDRLGIFGERFQEKERIRQEASMRCTMVSEPEDGFTYEDDSESEDAE